ncbi:MAG: YeeE/YedE family protein [Clostridia bacterium]|nr:YeeE/YedE family protein [Clostridia bacterium]
MTAYLFPGVLGLLTGLLLRWNGFSRPAQTRLALGLKRSCALRSALTALGWGMAGTALLCWLAVIDVDQIEVLPLSAGALVGGLLFGAAAGLCGFTPTTAFAGLSTAPLEALCVLAGCFAGTWLLPELDSLLSPLRTAAPYSAATLFQVTLDEPWLLDGGFLGQGCAGLLLAAIAICIPAPRPILLTDIPAPEEIPAAEISASAGESQLTDPEVESEPADSPASSELPDPEVTASPVDADPADPAAEAAPESSSEVAAPPAIPGDSLKEEAPLAAQPPFVALLEGEEPLIVDTALDEDDPDSAALPPEPDDADPPEKAK